MFFECKMKKDRCDRRGRCSDDDDRHYSKRENRCGKHGCHGKCGYAMVDGVKYYAPYCHDHACMVGPQRCRRVKSRDEIYCSLHATCTAEGCRATPDRLSGKPLPWFCDTHKCVYPSCVSFGCYGGYCSTHISLCAVGGCPGQRGPNSPFCEFHSQKAAQQNTAPPPAQMVPPPAPPGAVVYQCDVSCTEHRHGSNKACRPDMFCRTPGCHRLRQTKDGGESEWCENHTCDVYMCIRRRSDRQPSMRTCERHACAVERCDRPATPSHGGGGSGGTPAFCRRHGCEADNCGQYKDAQSWFCNQHECRRARCLNKAVVGGAEYCLRHLEEQQQQQQQQEGDKKKKKDKEEDGGSGGGGGGGGRACRWQHHHQGDAPPLVIVREAAPATATGCWREPRSRSPPPPRDAYRGRRGGVRLEEEEDRYYTPDCVDDARAGRAHRGYYDRVETRHRRRHWDD